LLILVATIGITGTMAVLSPDPSLDDRPRPVAPSRAPGRKPAPAPSFDAECAASGEKLHGRLLDEADVAESYRVGTLFGAMTQEPQASIAVPLDAWESLNDDERSELMHYAASLVEPMRTDPLTYGQIRASAPAASMVRENVNAMTPLSWVIHSGRLELAEGSDSFNILTDEAVASGRDNHLVPKRNLSSPNEVVARLRRAGLLVDTPWRRSNFDGVWVAVLRKPFGENEVSCLLESRSRSTIETIELEAEIYRPGRGESDVFRAFAEAAQVLSQEEGLLDAIEAKEGWSSGKWRLKRERHASGDGYSLTLRKG